VAAIYGYDINIRDDRKQLGLSRTTETF